VKAIIQSRYGTPDVLAFADVERPEPGDREALVRVRATSVGPWVWRLLEPDPRIMRIAGAGLFRPKRLIPAGDLAGTVEAVGRHVTRLQPGDQVYGEAAGSFAEYTCVSEDALAPMPKNLTFEQAAAVPVAANTALMGLRDHGRVQLGDSVLIIGASGGVGSFAVQIAKAFGAEVTGVCSTGSIATVAALGADHIVDYTVEDFATSGRRYDVVFQLAGTESASRLRASLTPKGRLVMGSGEGGPWIGPIGRLVAAMILSPFVRQSLRPLYARPNRANLLTLTEMIEAGTIAPLIDRTYPLSDAAAAFRSARDDHVHGKIAITV